MMEKTRRTMLKALLAVPPSLVLLPDSTLAQTADLPLTPSCAGREDETLQQTQGPYYRPDAPLRSSLGPAAAGQSLFTLCGFVIDTSCNPVPGAIVEIWHADHEGNYDNRGFGLRGHQLTDAKGRWGFDTIMTHHYSLRTAHYHFRVEAPGRPLLTTQLYLPDHPRNDKDQFFDPRLLMVLDRTKAIGRFNFVLAA